MKYPIRSFFLLTFIILFFSLLSCTTTASDGSTQKVSAADIFYTYSDGPWLVLGDEPSTQVNIVWTRYGDQDDSEIMFGPDKDDMTIIPADDNKGKIRAVMLKNLIPAKVYYYALPSRPDDIKSFSLPDPDKAVNFTVIGDLQPRAKISKQGVDVMKEYLAELDTDFFVQLGDISDVGGILPLWNSALSRLSVFADETPIATVIGNHDYYLDDSGRNFRDFFPRNYPSGKKGYYYSLDISNVHLVFLDNFDKSLKGTMTQEQQIWAENDIKKASSGSDWIFIFMHHTMLTTATSSTNRKLREWIIPLADKYGVTAVFFGHDHHYEHWQHKYGHDGLVYQPDHAPSGNTVQYFCSGSAGVQSEVQYGLLDHDPIIEQRKYWDLDNKEWKEISVERLHWDTDTFIDYQHNPAYGHFPDGKHYYHLAGFNDFSTDNTHYGYQYGEQTMHYIQINIDGKKCEISVHYPNGDLLKGPSGSLEQKWEYIQ